MAEYIQRPFAEDGLKQDIAVDTTVDGTVSYQSGWTEKYGIDPAVDPANAKFPDLKDFNELNYNTTSNIKEWQEQTFPNWIADKGDGNPFEYSGGAVVHYTDGKNYVSTIDNNDGEPTVDSGWKIVSLLISQTTNPTTVTNPSFNGAVIANTTTGEMFVCTDNTTDKNKWQGTDGTVIPQPIMNSVFGRLWNQTDDKYKRVGLDVTKFTQDTQIEFRKWLRPTDKRVNDNDMFDFSDLTQELNSNKNLPFANMFRKVVSNTGVITVFDGETAPSVTEQIMTQIEKCYYIDALVVADGKQYDVKLTSKTSFSIDLEDDLGLKNITSATCFNPTVGISSGTVSGNTITSALHPAFTWHTGSTADLTLVGSFCSVSGRSTFGATPTNNISIVTARSQHTSFGTDFNQHDFWNNSLIQLLAYIERGSNWLEGSGTKWDGNSNSFSTYGQNTIPNGKTLVLGNNTGVIKDNSGRVIANSYRGIENYHSNLYVWIDALNINNGLVYLAKAGATFVSDIATSPYFSSGNITKSTTGWQYIKEWLAGTFIPNPSVGGTSDSKVTDQMYGNTGWRVLQFGGYSSIPGISGLSCWYGGNASSAAFWAIVSRSSFRKFF